MSSVCFHLSAVCIGMFFSSAWSSWQVWQQIRAGFLLAGVRGSWFPPKQTVIWVEAFHRTSSTRVHEHIWKTGDCRVENGAIHTIVFINRQQFHESCLCSCWIHCIGCFAACSSHSAHITHPDQSHIRHTDHVYPLRTPSPGIYQGNPALTQARGPERTVSLEMRCQPLWVHIQREWITEVFLLRLCFVYKSVYVCVSIIASVEGACLSVLWLWGADSSPRVRPRLRRLTHQCKHTHNTFSHKGAYPQNPPLMEAPAVFSWVFMHSFL